MLELSNNLKNGIMNANSYQFSYLRAIFKKIVIITNVLIH